MEVLAPVGSQESLIAAVRSGADAVYLGAKAFSARRNATNFDDEQLEQAVQYCHKHNVKVLLAVNILIKEKELKEVLELVDYLYQIRVDALIVQDLGLAKIIHENYPDFHLHGSTQMSVHHLAALPLLASLGFKRIVVAREMSKQEVSNFCLEAKKYDIEVEYFVHGALCMSVSGQCLLSAMIGQRSGNRGLCAQPCRLPFKVSNGTGHDLSLKDSSLFAYVKELEEMGVVSLKIEGRMKRPEYVALATYCCKQAVLGNQYDDKLLKDVFSRSGFTDGYYTNHLGKEMFGVRTQEDAKASLDSFNKIHELYRNEIASVPVNFQIRIKRNEPIKLSCGDVTIESETPLEATNKPSNKEEIIEMLSKLGGSCYFLEKCEVEIDEGLFVRNALIKDLRRRMVEKLDESRKEPNKNKGKKVELENEGNYQQLADTYIRLANLEQLPEKLKGIKGVIVPIDSDIKINNRNYIIEIPRWIANAEYIKNRLEKFKEIGINKCYCNNIAALQIGKECGYEIMGGNFLNVTNNYSLKTLKENNVSCAVMSVELSLKEIAGVNSYLPKGIISYGRVPLMLLKNCPLKNGRSCNSCDKKGFISDRTGTNFPIRCQFGVSELLNSKPIYLADKLTDISNVSFQILYFTIENKKEVKEVIDGYANNQKVIADYTRGLYYRSVL